MNSFSTVKSQKEKWSRNRDTEFIFCSISNVKFYRIDQFTTEFRPPVFVLPNEQLFHGDNNKRNDEKTARKQRHFKFRFCFISN